MRKIFNKNPKVYSLKSFILHIKSLETRDLSFQDVKSGPRLSKINKSNGLNHFKVFKT